MANLQKGEVGFEADGKVWTLVYSVNALCALEADFDDMLGTLAELMTGKSRKRVTTLRAVLRAGLAEHHGEMTLAEAGKLMQAVGMKVIFDKVAKAVVEAFPETSADPLPEAAPQKVKRAA